jgi:hypothetical protein
MARERSELEQRRAELTRSLPGLSEAEVAADAAIRAVQHELRGIDAEIKRRPRPGLGARFGTRRSPSTRHPISVPPLARRAVDSFDHPGLFLVPLDRPRAISAAAKTHEPPPMRPGRARVAQTDRHKNGLHRYCSGCEDETEHVAWAADGRESTPSIRWPSTEPAIGTTICLNCGQWRAASPQPRPPAWSNWPRSRLATPSLAIAAESTDTADDWVPETVAENEGMPPRREPRRPRISSARLRRAHAVTR